MRVHTAASDDYYRFPSIDVLTVYGRGLIQLSQTAQRRRTFTHGHFHGLEGSDSLAGNITVSSLTKLSGSNLA